QYLVLREEMREMQLAAQKNQAKKIEETEKLIEKFRYKATKASMAQSLIKKLDKIERIEVDEDDQSVMNISFPVAVQPGKVVLEIEKVSKSFDDKVVFKDIDLLIERGSKIAFVGQNGQGKSTLIKAIIDEFDYQGSIKLGHNVQLGYFAQNQAEYLDGEKTLLDTMLDEATDSNRSKVRDMLGAFLFRGDDVDKKVKVLSGGERNRLALCMMLLKPINVLLMDEPTNHLDIQSKNVLKEALKNYEGTLILVSHDRDFLQGLTERVYEFRDGKLKEYLGDIDFYLEQRKADDFRAIEKKSEVNVIPVEGKKLQRQLSFEEQKELKGLKNKISKIESEIVSLEHDLESLEKELVKRHDELHPESEFFENYNRKKQHLEKKTELWYELTENLQNKTN